VAYLVKAHSRPDRFVAGALSDVCCSQFNTREHVSHPSEAALRRREPAAGAKSHWAPGDAALALGA
jgi:hypothetical protein